MFLHHLFPRVFNKIEVSRWMYNSRRIKLSAVGANPLGGSGGMPPRKILKIIIQNGAFWSNLRDNFYTEVAPHVWQINANKTNKIMNFSNFIYHYLSRATIVITLIQIRIIEICHFIALYWEKHFHLHEASISILISKPLKIFFYTNWVIMKINTVTAKLILIIFLIFF